MPCPPVGQAVIHTWSRSASLCVWYSVRVSLFCVCVSLSLCVCVCVFGARTGWLLCALARRCPQVRLVCVRPLLHIRTCLRCLSVFE